MTSGSQGKARIFRLSIKPTGKARSRKKVRQDVATALNEALDNLRKDKARENVRAKARPEGPFVGVTVATVWVLKMFGAGLLGGAGTAAGKKLVAYFFETLRSRRLDPGPATSVAPVSQKRNSNSAKRGKGKK